MHCSSYVRRIVCLLQVYEHITYDNIKHISLASLPGMQERTIITSSLSKTFSVTGQSCHPTQLSYLIISSCWKIQFFNMCGIKYISFYLSSSVLSTSSFNYVIDLHSYFCMLFIRMESGLGNCSSFLCLCNKKHSY